MLRVNFTDTDSSNSYTVPYNPVAVELLQNVNRSVISDISAYPVLRTSTVDNRVRSLQWASYETSTAFDAMVAKLKSFVGRTKIVDFKDFDYNSLGTQTIKVLNVRKVIQNTFKGLRYSLALDFVFQNSIITETLPASAAAATLSDLTTAFSLSGAIYVSIAADDANYCSDFDGAPTFPDDCYRFHDQIEFGGTRRDWVQIGTNALPILHRYPSGDTDINNREYLEYALNSTRSYQNEQGPNITGDDWADFMADTETTGYTFIMMMQPQNTGETAETIKALFDTCFAYSVVFQYGALIRWNSQFHATSECVGLLSPNSSYGLYFNTYNSPVGSFPVDAWRFLIMRVTWGDGAVGNATLEYFNGTGSNSSTTNNRAIQSSSIHSTRDPQLGSATPQYPLGDRKFSGRLTLSALYNRPLSDAELTSILTTVNSYYSTSFSLT